MPLPCPFCSHVGLDFKEGSTFRWIIAECGGCGASRGETRIQTMGEGTKEEWMATAQADAIKEWNTREALAQPVADDKAGGQVRNTESTGRISEFEGKMRIRWLKSLVEKQQDANRSDNGYVEHDTGAWVGPEWVDTVHEALDDLVSAAEASKGFRFLWTRCSSCGQEFGPGDCGYSHCSDHVTHPQPQAAQPAERVACNWQLTDDDNMIYESACGEAWVFNDGGPKENNVRFCQGCGKPVNLLGIAEKDQS